MAEVFAIAIVLALILAVMSRGGVLSERGETSPQDRPAPQGHPGSGPVGAEEEFVLQAPQLSRSLSTYPDHAVLTGGSLEGSDARDKPVQGKSLRVTERAQSRPSSYWKRRALRAERRLEKLPGRGLAYGIRLAAAAYGQSAVALRRVMLCESSSNARAVSAGGHRGAFQYLPSTWRSLPFRGFSPHDPVAAALATAYAWKHGRKGEWQCR